MAITYPIAYLRGVFGSSRSLGRRTRCPPCGGPCSWRVAPLLQQVREVLCCHRIRRRHGYLGVDPSVFGPAQQMEGQKVHSADTGVDFTLQARNGNGYTSDSSEAFNSPTLTDLHFLMNASRRVTMALVHSGAGSCHHRHAIWYPWFRVRHFYCQYD